MEIEEIGEHWNWVYNLKDKSSEWLKPKILDFVSSDYLSMTSKDF